jgi:electron transfer flavoprotein alpha subunit
VKIVCLVKQVPHFSAIEFDEETKSLKREGVPLELNVFDRFAVQHAVALREQAGGEVIAMTMGPPSAEEALTECLRLGADRAIHLSDRVFAVADTIGTSRTLAMAITKEGAELVVCGRKTLDSETWQVPPEVAAFLRWPHLTNAADLSWTDGHLRLVRETDFGAEVFEADPPVLVSVGRPGPEASGAGDGRIDVWQASDLVDDVQENDKRFGQPGSPTRVLAVRDSRPERAGHHAADLDDAVARTAALLEERRQEPPPWDKPAHLAEQPGARYDCWTMIETAGGRPRRISLELLGRGRDLAGKLGGKNVALTFESGLEGELGRYGAEVVALVDDARLADYHPELWAAALRAVLERERPHVLLVPATGRGRDYGPRAAGELELGMTGDCIGVDIAKAGRLLQQKPAYGGNITSVILGATTPQLATVRPRMFEPLEPRDGQRPEVRTLDVGPLPDPRIRLVDRQAEADSYLIDDAAAVILVGGQGLPDALEPPWPVAGTKDAVEAGLLARPRQVGVLGRPIAPRLLVAVGVPGSEEEVGGFVKAGVVVAVRSPGLGEAADVLLDADPREALAALAEGVSPALGSG